MPRLAPLKKPLPKGAQAAGKGNTSTSSGGNTKTEKRRGPPPQKQTSSDTNFKQNQRLPKSKANPRAAIDLTLDDSDTEAPIQDCKEKIRLPIKGKVPVPKRLKRPPSPEPPLSLTSTSLHLLDSMTGIDSGLGPSGGEPPSKRARYEDGTESDSGAGMVEHYYVASPLPTTSLKSSTTAVDDPQSSTQPALQEASLPSIDTDLPPSKVQCIPGGSVAAPPPPQTNARPVPYRPNQPATSPAPDQDVDHACANHTISSVATKPEQDIKPENDPTEHKSPSIPCLAEKIKLAREFSAVMAVPERDAYQKLMKQRWDVDAAVLAHMESKEG